MPSGTTSRTTGPPTLTDGVVTIRPFRDDDLPGVVDQSQDAASVRWTRVPTPYGLPDAQRFVHEVVAGGWASGERWTFAVEVEQQYAGTVELRDLGEGLAEIAFSSRPATRGTGVMERACRLLLEWGFGQQEVRTVVWYAHVGNWPSRRLAWRLGFTLGGILRGFLSHRGDLVDAWSGTLLSTDDREPQGSWLETPPLSDGVVRLRPLRATDADRVVEAAADERTQRWLGRMPAPYTEVEAAQWMEHVLEAAATGETVTWAVTEDDDVLRGVVNLFDIAPGNSAEVGFWTHPDARGRGLMTRATVLVLRYGFATFDLVRIQGHAALANAASRHVLEASGLREAGVARLGTFIRPEGRVDAMKYDVLVEEWRPAPVVGDAAPGAGIPA